MRESLSTTIYNFFVLEGLDGSGKTTLTQKIQNSLPSIKIEQEPTKSSLGLFIRNLIKSSQQPLENETLLLLFSADRWEHIYGQKGIMYKDPKDIVLCDRYLFSSLVYQAETSKSYDYAKSINSVFPLPEKVFYLDISPEESLRRIQKRGEQLSRFENLSYLQKIWSRYEKILNDFQKNYNLSIMKIDASQNSDDIAHMVLKEILHPQK